MGILFEGGLSRLEHTQSRWRLDRELITFNGIIQSEGLGELGSQGVRKFLFPL